MFLKGSMAVFSKWSNKGWAIMDSLRSVVKIGMVPVTYTLVALPMCTFAATDSLTVSKNVDINEVVVNAVAKKNVYSEMSRIVISISRDEIGKAPIHSVQDLLEQVLGADIRSRGALGVQADVSLRGGSFDQVLILLNGVNITDPQTGHHNLNLPHDIESVDRIEILQGPGTRIYGPNAFTGAINIVTGEQKESGAKVGITAGEYGYFSSFGSASWAKKSFRNFISVSHARSDGYSANTDFNTRSLFYHGQLASLLGTTSLQAGFSDKGFGANSFYTPKYPNQYERTKSIFTSLSQAKVIGGFSLNSQAYWRRHQDRFELFRNNPAAWYKNHNYHLTDVIGGERQVNYSTEYSRTSLGAEYRYEHIYSNNLGVLFSDTLSVPGESSGFFNRQKARHNANFNLEQTIYLKGFVVSAGAMALWNSEFGWDKSFGIDASYALTRDVRLFGSVNQSLRLPTFTDLYYSGPTNEGNSDLKPEHALSYEVGIKSTMKSVGFQLSLIRREGTDVIDWVKDPIDTKYKTRNLTNVTTNGLEVGGYYSFGELFEQAPGSSKLQVTYSYYKNEKESGSLISAYSLDYLKQKLAINLTSTLYKGFGFTFKATYQDRAGSFTTAADKEVSYSPFTVCDVRIFKEFKHFTLFAEAANVFDNDYVDIGNIEQPGRWFKAGFKFEL